MATYYISVSGSNGNPGTLASPWATLAYAYDTSTTDDTLHLMAGTHTFVSDTLTSRTIEGDSATTTIVDGGGAGELRWSVGEVTIQDLTFTNMKRTASLSQMPPFSCFTNSVFNRVIVHNIEVGGGNHNYAGYGVWNGSDSTSMTLNGCLIYNIKKGASTYAAIMSATNTADPDMTFRNCTIEVENISTLALTHIVANNQQYSSKTPTFTNCIIYNSTGGAVDVSEANRFSSTYTCWRGTFNEAVTGTGNITSDPLFIDAANRDYRLRPASGCIDSGVMI